MIKRATYWQVYVHLDSLRYLAACHEHLINLIMQISRVLSVELILFWSQNRFVRINLRNAKGSCCAKMFFFSSIQPRIEKLFVLRKSQTRVVCVCVPYSKGPCPCSPHFPLPPPPRLLKWALPAGGIEKKRKINAARTKSTTRAWCPVRRDNYQPGEALHAVTPFIPLPSFGEDLKVINAVMVWGVLLRKWAHFLSKPLNFSGISFFLV